MAGHFISVYFQHAGKHAGKRDVNSNNPPKKGTVNNQGFAH